MSVDQATVRRVAKLARIRVKDEELPVLANELNSILHWIEQLNAVDVRMGLWKKLPALGICAGSGNLR